MYAGRDHFRNVYQQRLNRKRNEEQMGQALTPSAKRRASKIKKQKAKNKENLSSS